MNVFVRTIEPDQRNRLKLPMNESQHTCYTRWLEKYPQEAEAFAAMSGQELVCVFDALTSCCDTLMNISDHPRLGLNKAAAKWIEQHLDTRLVEIRQTLVSSLYFREFKNQEEFEACWEIVLKYAGECCYEIDEVLRLVADFNRAEPRKLAQTG